MTGYVGSIKPSTDGKMHGSNPAGDYVSPSAGEINVVTSPFSVDENVGTINVALERTGGTSGAVSVDYSTHQGTALASQDYAISVGTAQWADGESGQKVIQVSIIDDVAEEPAEYFTVSINNPTNGVILGSTTSTTITINASDTATGGGGGGGGDPGTYDYYVNSSTGSDSNDGSVNAPWATIAHARANAGSGVTIGVAAGSYSFFHETSAPGLSDYQEFYGESGVALSGLSLEYSGDAYLKLYGFNILYNGSRVINASGTNKWSLDSCEIHASYYVNSGYLITGVYVLDCDDWEVKNCYVHDVCRGILWGDCNNILIRRNKLSCTAGTIIYNGLNNYNSVIELNHGFGNDYNYLTDPGVPSSWASDPPHHSMISIRSGNTTIRKNIFHGHGSSSGFMFYDDPIASNPNFQYDNIRIENNAVYHLQNDYAMRIFGLGVNVHINNNLFFGRRRSGSCTGSATGDVYRYNVAFVVHSRGALLSDDSGLHTSNNIYIGGYLHRGSATAYTNYCYSINYNTWVASISGGSTALTTNTSPTNCSGLPLDFEEANNVFQSAHVLTTFVRTLQDFTLAAGSPLINAGTVSVQPSDSLGSVDADGFINDDGPARDASHHTIGPWELA